MSSISHVISAHLENAFTEIHTAFPAQVVRYDHIKQCADLQPVIKKRFIDGTVLAMPILHNVPIIFPSTAECIIALPVAPDDTVLVIVCERSIDAWLTSDGSQIDPDDTRKLNLSDAVAIVGLSPLSKKVPHDINALVLKNKKSQIVLEDTNELYIYANSKLNIESDDDIVILSAKSIEIKSDSDLSITCNNATIKADKVSIDASETSFTGNIECQKIECKSLESQTTVKAQTEVMAGAVTLTKHTHMGVMPGGGATSPPQG